MPQGAFLVPANTTVGRSVLVESAQANIFTSMYYVISDTTTSACACWWGWDACMYVRCVGKGGEERDEGYVVVLLFSCG